MNGDFDFDGEAKDLTDDYILDEIKWVSSFFIS